MSESEYRGFGWQHVIALFLAIVLTAIATIELSQSFFSELISIQGTWFLFSSVDLAFISFVVVLIVWRMKAAFQFLEPQWEFQERFVTLSEFKEMMVEYRREYALLASEMRPIFIMALIIAATLCIGTPFLLGSVAPVYIFFLPQVFGAAIAIYGVGVVMCSISILPSPVDVEFPIYRIKCYRSAIKQLQRIPSLYWIGIFLVIGHWSGYYTIRSPRVAAKIDGMESAATLFFDVDSGCKISSAQVTDGATKTDFSDIDVPLYPSETRIEQFVRDVVIWYVRRIDDYEMLEDTLDELGIHPSDIEPRS
jgi:hypothetical protein